MTAAASERGNGMYTTNVQAHNCRGEHRRAVAFGHPTGALNKTRCQWLRSMGAKLPIT